MLLTCRKHDVLSTWGIGFNVHILTGRGKRNLSKNNSLMEAFTRQRNYTIILKFFIIFYLKNDCINIWMTGHVTFTSTIIGVLFLFHFISLPNFNIYRTHYDFEASHFLILRLKSKYFSYSVIFLVNNYLHFCNTAR